MKFTSFGLIVVLLVLVIVFFITLLVLIVQSSFSKKLGKVEIGNTTINVEIADTFLKRARGLMFRKVLPENYGMLFIFNYSARTSFWMKNTLIPLDLIFIDNGRVVEIKESLSPCKGECKIYTSKRPAKYVVEVPAGFVKKNDIKINTSARVFY